MQTHFDIWIFTIKQRNENVDMITSLNNLKFMSVKAVWEEKRKEKSVKSSFSNCQLEYASLKLSDQDYSYSEALMALLLHQMMMSIQQQLTMLSQQQQQQFTASEISLAYTLPQLQSNLTVQSAETVLLSLSLMSVSFCCIILLKQSTSSFNKHLSSSPIESIDDRGSYLQIYIN